MALSQPRQENRVDDALIDAAGPAVSAAQLAKLKAERMATRTSSGFMRFGHAVSDTA